MMGGASRLLRATLFGSACALAQTPPATVDAFRFLEDTARPESEAFYREQDARAREALARIPGREALAARVRTLSEGAATVSELRWAAGRLFYLRQAPREARAAIAMREGLTSPERVLVDAERLARAGDDPRIEALAPSPDGRHVAYGVSSGERTTVRVFAVATGRDLPGTIEGVHPGEEIGWHPDGQSFYYTRARSRGDRDLRVHRHVLGRESARDEPVFGNGIGGVKELPGIAQPSIHVPLESKFAYAVVREGVRREISVFISPLKDLSAGQPHWRRIVFPADQVTAMQAWRDDLFLLSFLRAPNGRVLRLDPSRPQLTQARVAIREGESLMESIGLARDAIYLRTTVGGVDRLEKLAIESLGTRAAVYVRTPFDYGISELVVHPRRPGALVRIEGWNEPPVIGEVDAKSAELRDTKLHPVPGADFSDMVQVRLYAPAGGGARIPVTLVYKASTQLTGNLATILEAYGSYGLTPRPRFVPERLAWLERGGVFAIAHVRGGGEFGERWHEAGRGANKVTTIEDLTAVADFLAQYGFTNRKRLALSGTEAGGIPVAGALARRPELFAAALLRAPLVDMLHHEASPDGAARVSEFGSARVPRDLETLHAISAHHHLRDGASYPGVLATVGLRDAQVPPWHAGKLVARLQAVGSRAPALLRVDMSRGHSATRVQGAEEIADRYAFLLWQLGEPGYEPMPAVQVTPLAAPPAPVPQEGKSGQSR